MFLCYPAALGSIRPGASAGELSAVEQCFWQVSRGPARAAQGKSSCWFGKKPRAFVLVCRCTSSHDQKTRGRRFSSASLAVRTLKDP